MAAKVQIVCIFQLVSPIPFTAIVCYLRGLNGWYLSEHKGSPIHSVNLVHMTSVIEIVGRQDLSVQVVSHFPEFL